MRVIKLGWILSVTSIAACGGAQPEPETPSDVQATDGESEPPQDSADASEAAAEGEAAQSSITAPSASAPDPSEANAADAHPGSEPLGAPTETTKPLGNTVEETRTSEVIADVVRKQRQLFRDCYEKELARSPGLRGNLTLHFVVDPRGQVSSAEVNTERSTLTQPLLGKCALDALRKLQFPPSSRGFESTVNYPFDFKP